MGDILGDEENREILLLGFGDQCALFNLHTGELHRLAASTSYDLSVGDDGQPMLFTGDGCAPRPAADMMKMKLEAGPDGRLHVRRDADVVHSLEDLRSQYSTFALNFGLVESAGVACKFECEAYHFASGAAGWTIFWVYGFLTDALGLTTRRHIRYHSLIIPWKAKISEFLGFIDPAASADDHFRVSSRALQARCHERGDEALPMSIFTAEADHSFSTFALVLVLAIYLARPAHGRRSTQMEKGVILTRSRIFMRLFLRKFVLGDADFSYAIDGVEVPFHIRRVGESVRVDWRSVLGKARCLSKAKIPVQDGFADVSEVLPVLYADATTYYLGASRIAASKFVVAALADIVCAAVELSKGCDIWLGFDVCRLALRRAEKKRRRLSPAFKISASQVAASAKRIRTVPQLISAKSFFDDGQLGESGKSTLEFANTERFNYMVSSLQEFGGCRSIGICCDGTTLGSDDMLAVHLVNGETGRSAWGPPQAVVLHNCPQRSRGASNCNAGVAEKYMFFDTTTSTRFFDMFLALSRYIRFCEHLVFRHIFRPRFFDTFTGSGFTLHCFRPQGAHSDVSASFRPLRCRRPLPCGWVALVPLPQVQKMLRWRKGVTKKYSADDKKVWQQRIRAFMHKVGASETVAQRRKRLNCLNIKVPRLATFNWLRDVLNSLAAVSGKRWSSFGPQQSLLEDDTPLEMPAFCVVCTDEEGKQPAGINFLKREKGLFAEHVRGPIHRRTNDSRLLQAHGGECDGVQLEVRPMANIALR